MPKTAYTSRIFHQQQNGITAEICRKTKTQCASDCSAKIKKEMENDTVKKNSPSTSPLATVLQTE
jgi:hypothetical protein